MSARVSFADLLKAEADKDKQKLEIKPAPTPLKAVVPEKDFNKRANSLERDALPKGLFPGASKAIYDALYVRTLGAINPTNQIQATRRQIINWSGVKNIKTVNAHLRRLEDNGLVKRSNFKGEHSGNYYEIFLPNQSKFPGQNDSNIPDPDQTQPRPDPNRKLGLDQAQKMVWVGSGNLIENKDTYGFPKTSLKTKRDDDEPAAPYTSDNKFFGNTVLVEDGRQFSGDGLISLSDPILGVIEFALNGISKKLIGKELRSADEEKLKELAELLVMELEIAAARTDSITNVPAFLTEHLRRRLSGKSNIQSANQISAAKSRDKSQVGKIVEPAQSTVENYYAESLTEQARETVLKTMREYIGRGQREFVISLQNTYTADDWKWLSENLWGKNLSKSEK